MIGLVLPAVVWLATAPIASSFVPTSDGAVSVPASPYQPDLTPGYVLIEGDIQIPLAEYRALLGRNKGRVQTYGTYGPATLWPANTVPYDFVTTGVGAVSSFHQAFALIAMNAIAVKAGVTFRAATASDANRIRFQESMFNNAPIGMRGGVQTINIASWLNPISICHEVFHSLGFQHEQSRPDRDTYVTIAGDNICGIGSSVGCTAGTAPGNCCLCLDNAGNCVPCAFNLDIVSGSSTYGPYDFDSFMHYRPTEFSCNGNPTITVNPPYADAIGQRDHVSYFDGITCRALYPFSTDRWWDPAYGGSADGSFPNPYHNSTMAGAAANVPVGGTLLIKYAGALSAVGTYPVPLTIIAPNGASLGR